MSKEHHNQQYNLYIYIRKTDLGINQVILAL